MMIGFTRKVRRPITAEMFSIIYGYFGWEVVLIYVLIPLDPENCYIKVSCRKEILE